MSFLIICYLQNISLLSSCLRTYIPLFFLFLFIIKLHVLSNYYQKGHKRKVDELKTLINVLTYWIFLWKKCVFLTLVLFLFIKVILCQKWNKLQFSYVTSVSLYHCYRYWCFVWKIYSVSNFWYKWKMILFGSNCKDIVCTIICNFSLVWTFLVQWCLLNCYKCGTEQRELKQEGKCPRH